MNNSYRNIIFLDIDGVINPVWDHGSFGHDMSELMRKLLKIDKLYSTINSFELGYAYFNWDIEAIKRIKKLCVDFNAFIVISSDWRYGKSIEQLKLLFQLYGLENYVVGKTADLQLYRDEEVKHYLKEHPEIEKFVIIDDNYEDAFEIVYPNNFVHCYEYIFNEEAYKSAVQILSSIIHK